MFLEPSDLAPFADIDEAKALAMIDDAEAQAMLAAPCLDNPDVQLTASQRAAVKAILRGAVLRWNESGTGAYQQETAGPISVTMDTRQSRRSLFWPSEVDALSKMCAAITGASGKGGAWSVDLTAGLPVRHMPWCNLNFGATYCSCGADIAGYPIYETDGEWA